MISQTTQDMGKGKQTAVLSWRVLFVVLSGFVAAWISSGAIGLLAHPLRKILAFMVLGLTLFLLPLSSSRRWQDVAWRLVGVVLAVWMMASNFLPINILAVAILLACLGLGISGTNNGKEAILMASCSVAIYGIYQLAYTSIPAVWLAADAVSKYLGLIVGTITRSPLLAGSTFVGLDFLVLIFSFFCTWLIYSRFFRIKPIIYGTAAILAGHMIYLLILSWCAPGIQKLPQGHLSGVLKYLGLSLWHLPQLASYIHLIIAGIIIKHLTWSQKPGSLLKLNPRLGAITLAIAGLLFVSLLAVFTTLYPPQKSLKDSKIVVYEHGFLNWLRPKHGNYGRLSSGMYGMMSDHVEALGGRYIISPDLSEEDLADAQLVAMFYPNESWPEGTLERLWKFVEQGGSLLVLGEHTVKESDGGSRFNDVLAPTNMRVVFDSATFAIGGWLHSYQSMSHPAFMGIGDDRNGFGVVIGASLDIRWPARPLLIGRWGWSDFGTEDGPAKMGNSAYDAGERLGDLILAAEQRFGKGRIIAFGDTSGFTNGILVDSHTFVYRLFSYLVNKPCHYQPIWRQTAALFCAILLSLLIIYSPGALQALCIVLLVIALTLCQSLSLRNKGLLPDGRLKHPNNLAYIDATHLPAFSEESWRDDGTMGLALTLIRNGYLTLSLPEFTREHLERAGLLVLIAPWRTFTKKQRQILYEFVDKGGILICTVGYEDAEPIRPLLSDFGFAIGLPEAQREPQSLGYFKAPYLNTGDYMSFVRFHAAWPVTCYDPKARVLAYGKGDTPVIIYRSVGQGKIVVIGDTYFAMNKNLEHQDGSPFEGMRENANFWRWFITRLKDEPMWIPSREYFQAQGLPGQMRKKQ